MTSYFFETAPTSVVVSHETSDVLVIISDPLDPGFMRERAIANLFTGGREDAIVVSYRFEALTEERAAAFSEEACGMFGRVAFSEPHTIRRYPGKDYGRPPRVLGSKSQHRPYKRQIPYRLKAVWARQS